MADKKRITRSSKPKTASGQRTLLELFSSMRHRDPEVKDSLTAKGENEASTIVLREGICTDSITSGLQGVAPFGLSTDPSSDESTSGSKKNEKQESAPPAKRNYPLFDKPMAVNKPIHAQKYAPGDEIICITSDEPAGSSGIYLTKPSESLLSNVFNDPYNSSPRSRAVADSDLTASSDGCSRHNPIVLDLSSPLKPPCPQHSKPSKPIFSRPGATPDPSHPTSSPLKGGGNDLDAPFPSSDSQHVRGPQNSHVSPGLSYDRRGKDKNISIVDDHQDQSPFTYFRESGSNSVCQHSCTFNLHFQPHSTDFDRVHYLSTIPRNDAQAHPAISGLVDKIRSHLPESISSSQQLWADKWRPTRANHILGNEQHSLYLRDWLMALELQYAPTSGTARAGKALAKEESKGLKRPQVTRAVAKKRRRMKRRIHSDEENDWIVESDQDEEPVMIDDDDVGFFQQMALKLQVKDGASKRADTPLTGDNDPPLRHDFDQKLTNTILLVGPPGCGKTAAVYACAAELDCEVFEVYPGIGKRSGASLDHLIGDVGKNHLVGRSHRRQDDPQTKDGLAAFFSQGKKGKEKGKCVGGVNSDRAGGNGIDETLEIRREAQNLPPGDSFGFLASSIVSDDTANSGSSRSTGPAAKVRQSMILLEEVDILFKEDSNFWPAIINIIKDCRRPVILTCNDITLVPTDDLPLQAVLRFQPCSSNAATTYLQIICLAERRLVERHSLLQLYESTHDLCSVDMPDDPIHSLSEGLPLPDLRRCIHYLQLYCSVLPEKPTISTGDIEDWRTDGVILPPSGTNSSETQGQIQHLRHLQGHADRVSFADCFLVRGPLETAEALSSNNYELSPDEELGHASLFNPSGPADRQKGLEFYIQDEVITAELLRLSSQQFSGDIRPATANFEASSLFQSRMAFQSQMQDVLECVIPLSAPLIPRPAVFLDYEPFIRQMVATDDLLERQSREVFEKAARMTRNSHKEDLPARWIFLSEEHQRILEATKFQALDG